MTGIQINLSLPCDFSLAAQSTVIQIQRMVPPTPTNTKNNRRIVTTGATTGGSPYSPSCHFFIEFIKHLPGGPPLKALQKLGQRQVRPHRHQQIHMVAAHVPFSGSPRPSFRTQTFRIKSSARIETSPFNTGLRYFIVHTKWHFKS